MSGVASRPRRMADGTKVVTLGRPATQDQKNTMMNYFKADSSQVQRHHCYKSDERDLLGNYVPSEQIKQELAVLRKILPSWRYHRHPVPRTSIT